MTQATKEKIPNYLWTATISILLLCVSIIGFFIKAEMQDIKDTVTAIRSTQLANENRLTKVETIQGSDHETIGQIRSFIQTHSWDKNK